MFQMAGDKHVVVVMVKVGHVSLLGLVCKWEWLCM